MMRPPLSTGVFSLTLLLAACENTGANNTQPSGSGGSTSATSNPNGGQSTAKTSTTTAVGGNQATSVTGNATTGGDVSVGGSTHAGGSTNSVATSTSSTSDVNGGSSAASSTATGGKGSPGSSSAVSFGGKASTTTPAGGNDAQGGASAAITNSAKSGGSGGASSSSSGSATGGAGSSTTTPVTTVFTSDGKSDATNGKSATVTEVTSGTADVTVNDSSASQDWEGFGGCFNEMGWNQLSSATLQSEAINLLFGSDGANFALGRIPIGASDYAMSRYTLDDTGSDVTPDSTESNRPAADTSLSKFSLARDQEKLIPYIKAAMAAKPGIRFWASPWTPPVWMKTGYAKSDGSGGTVKKPSYFDGGSMRTDDSTLKAHAQYFVKFIQGYKEQGINVETIAPQNEPNFEQNYPSCLWSSANYTNFVGKYLGPAIRDAGLGTKIMLGAMSNGNSSDKDQAVVSAVMADATAKAFISVVGVQWSMMEKLSTYKATLGTLPVWVSEHKCGNYPWNPEGYPTYVGSKAPNDIAYAVESWGYIRDAIKTGVTAYNAWNMVLDPVGKGIDTSRDWAQNTLLTVSGGKITKTPTYWVFRHVSQFAAPGGKVVATTGSGVDSIGFKNPDGGLVAVIYNSAAAKSTFTVSIGGKKLQFSMPAAAWATVYLPPKT